MSLKYFFKFCSAQKPPDSPTTVVLLPPAPVITVFTFAVKGNIFPSC